MIPIVQDKLEVCSVQEQMEEMMCMKKINLLCKFHEIDLIEEKELVCIKFHVLCDFNIS